MDNSSRYSIKTFERINKNKPIIKFFNYWKLQSKLGCIGLNQKQVKQWQVTTPIGYFFQN